MAKELESQISPKIVIGIISLLFLLVVIYPWIIAVSIVCFLIGFASLEHLDDFIKSSISSGRFGARLQNYCKNYITADGNSKVRKNVITETTADPLREYLEESQVTGASNHQPKLSQNQLEIVEPANASAAIQIKHASRSSQAQDVLHKLSDSPKKILSATTSRRASEDIPSLFYEDSFPNLQQGVGKERNNKTPSPSKSSKAASTPSPSPSLVLSPEIGTLRVDHDFKVDGRVDKAFGTLCTNIINYYISPSWAPYETRRQLRLCFKQLLTSAAEACYSKLICSETNSHTKVAHQKLIPLILYYLDKVLTRGTLNETPIISKESKKRLELKIRKLCRQIFEFFLNQDDKKCKLWTELCIAVLADGVLINVINLGKDKLPELFEELVKKLRDSKTAATSNSVSPVDLTRKETPHQFSDPLVNCSTSPVAVNDEPRISKANVSDGDTTQSKVPFLLDSFMDPPYNLEKPDPIVSRWRPTLKDIVSETDLLYPLIQYMKHVGGQQSLAYLQGVLDDFPEEGDPYCRRILELEYLPGFCRSSLLLETMGLTRVEMAMEVGADPSNIRRNSGHARSASYGGPSSSSFREFLKIEQGIVDGLPLTESSYQNNTPEQSVGVTLPGAGVVEPNLAFKRRPHLEMFIAKFIKSTTKSWKQFYDPLEEGYEPAKRAGIDAKSYEEWDHPEVNSRVIIEASNSDIYDSLIDLVTSLMRDSPVASPFLSGLANFLKPYMMPVFEEQLERSLTDVLSVDLLVSVTNLIAAVFEETVEKSTDDDDTHSLSLPLHSSFNTSQENIQYHHTSCTTCDQSIKSSIQSFLLSILKSFTTNMIDLDYFIKCLHRNRDYIFLFFVDVLDVLVVEIIEK